MKKISICLLLLMGLIGCSNQKAASTVSESTKESLSERESGVLDQIDNYELLVKGIYQVELVNRDGINTHTFHREFKGYPEDIKIIRDENGILEIEALVKNEDFVTAAPVKIIYEHDKAIQKATVQEDAVVKPTEPFDLEMFYSRNRSIRYKTTKDVEKTVRNPWGIEEEIIDIPITKDNIESIEYLELGIPEWYLVGKRSDFSHDTWVLFTLKNGEQYRCDVELYYRPEETDYEKNSEQPKWAINFVSVKKVE